MEFSSVANGLNDWCPRCAQRVDPGEVLPCSSCWEGRPVPDQLEEIVAVAGEFGARQAAWRAKRAAIDDWADDDEEVDRIAGRAHEAEAALDLLASVVDPGAATQLAHHAVSHPEPKVRAACANSLGWLEGRDHESVLELLLHDPSAEVRQRALSSLTETGSADVLARYFADAAASGDERTRAARGLAWLHDSRAVEHLRNDAESELRAGTWSSHSRTSTWAFVRVANAPDLEALAQDLRAAATREDAATAQAMADALISVVEWAAPEKLDGVVTALDGIATPISTDPDPDVASEPPTSIGPHRRTTGIPRRAIVGWQEAPPVGHTEWPRTKRGGQPDWRQAPSWPVDPEGRPLVFVGQFDLGGSQGRTAYVFCDETNDHTWEALGEGNAVVVQPGPLPTHIRCETVATGPHRYDRVQTTGFRIVRTFARPVELWAVEVEGFDPSSWDDEPGGDDERERIGGTAMWTQYEEYPPGDGWTFAFQFTTDVFDYYGYVDEQGRGGMIGQCG